MNGNVVAEQTVDLSKPLTEFQCDSLSVKRNIDKNTLSARVLVTNFTKYSPVPIESTSFESTKSKKVPLSRRIFTKINKSTDAQ